jgi:thioredoxin 1
MEPILDEVQAERKTAIHVVKVDTDQSPEIASKFRVTSLPNFILFRQGLPIAQRNGTTSKKDFLDWIDANLQQS